MATESLVLGHPHVPKPVILAHVQLAEHELRVLLESPVFSERFKRPLRRLHEGCPNWHAYSGKGVGDLWEIRVESVIYCIIRAVLAGTHDETGKTYHCYHQFTGPVSRAQDVRRAVKSVLGAAKDMQMYGLVWPAPGLTECTKWEERAYWAIQAITKAVYGLTVDLEGLGHRLSNTRGHPFDKTRVTIEMGWAMARDNWDGILNEIPDDIGELDVTLALETCEDSSRNQRGNVLRSDSIQLLCDRYTSALVDVRHRIAEALQSLDGVERELPEAMVRACTCCIADWPRPGV